MNSVKKKSVACDTLRYMEAWLTMPMTCWVGKDNRGLTEGWFSKRVVLVDVPPEREPERAYPLARNQYINNSPGIFSCIRAGADTCAACICTEINSLKIFLCIGTRNVRIQALYQYRGQGPKCEYIFQK